MVDLAVSQFAAGSKCGSFALTATTEVLTQAGSIDSCTVDDTVRRPAASLTGEPARLTRTARRWDADRAPTDVLRV